MTQVVKDQDRPLVWIQTLKGTGDDVRLLKCLGAHAGRSIYVLDAVDGDFADSAPAADGHSAGIDQNAMEPGVKGPCVTKSWKFTPCGEARLLSRVASVGLAAEDRPRRPKQGIDALAHERLERQRVARPCTID